MRRLLIVLVASVLLGLVGGVAPAWADLLPPPSGTDTSQTATQANDGSNSVNQTGTSVPVVQSGPNIAIANGDSCSPCGGSGTTTQNSGNNVDASSSNTATQGNNQSNAAGQTQAVDGGSSGSTTQSADQSNKGENSANQSATSAPVVVSGPNVAVLNSGDVNQNSGNNVDASSSNNANQTNNQSNSAGQSQTVAGNGCCSSHDGTSQSASQSNEGSNEANQTATSAPVVVSGGNYAIANKGDVNQNSGNNVDASSSNTANQTNNQQNSAGQSQTVADGGSGCCSDHSGTSQSADQSNRGSNSANQTATSAPVVVSGPNVAAFNGWGRDSCNPCGGSGSTVNQNSGNNVDASASNTATQTNNQSNRLGQSQSVTDGSGCCSGTGDVTQEARQSNSGENSADQTARSSPYVTSGGNYAFGNTGDVRQNSGNRVFAPASNSATQTNNQSNALGQSQTVNGSGSGCCSRTGDVSQSAEQSNWGKNSADQTAISAPVVESGPNVAFGKGLGRDGCNPCDGGGGGTVHQNSGNNVFAPASNSATQTNNQSNALGQTQTVNGAGSGCCGSGDVSQTASQSNRGKNEANQTAYSAPVVESGKNVAFFNHGDVSQNSGNNVFAPASNSATQTNNQSNTLGQSQTVDRGGCCPPSDCNDCNPCNPCSPCNPCPPPPCEPCGPTNRQPKANSGRGNLSETGTGTRQSDSSTLKNPHEGETGPGDYPTGDRDPGNSGLQNRGGD